MPHIIDANALWLGGGARFTGDIARPAIRRALAFQGSRFAWAAAHQRQTSDMLVVSHLDPPNVAIEIEGSTFAQIRLARRGRAIAPRRWILLYVDRPGELAAALMASTTAAA